MEAFDNDLLKKKHKKKKRSLANKEEASALVDETCLEKKTKKRKKNSSVPIIETDLTIDNELNGVSLDENIKKKKKKSKKLVATEENVDCLINKTDEEAVVQSKHIANGNTSPLALEEPSLKKKSKKKKEKKATLVIEEPSLMNDTTIENESMEVEDTYIEEADKNLNKKKKKKKKRTSDAGENVDEFSNIKENSDNNEGVGHSEQETNQHNFTSPSKKTATTNVPINVEENCIEKRPYVAVDNFDDITQEDLENAPKWLKKNLEKKNYNKNFTETILGGKKGRHYTVSIALPASILKETCLLQELRTYVIGQLARAACIYAVDEIVVFDDNWLGGYSENPKESIEECMGMMKMILEYQECPQYLRKDFFPMHEYMRKVSLLNACNSTHHLLAHQWCTYRDGIVLDKTSGKNSLVDVGLQSEVEIDRKLEPGLRVTVKFPPETETMKKLYGYVVSPEEPRTKCGLYWGYTVRLANSFSEVFKSDRFKDGYDMIIGTSDKGTDVHNTQMKPFNHALIVFGGVEGLEAAMKADKSLTETDPKSFFQYYINTCPNQQSRTIRTEEAVLITLCTLSDKLAAKGNTKPK